MTDVTSDLLKDIRGVSRANDSKYIVDLSSRSTLADTNKFKTYFGQLSVKTRHIQKRLVVFEIIASVH